MSRTHYVYVKEHEHGFVKIGKASDPLARRDSISTSSPYKIVLKYAISHLNSSWGGFDLESELHDKFEDNAVKNEWFDIEPEEVVEACEPYVDDDDISVMGIYDVQERKRTVDDYGGNRSEDLP